MELETFKVIWCEVFVFVFRKLDSTIEKNLTSLMSPGLCSNRVQGESL